MHRGSTGRVAVIAVAVVMIVMVASIIGCSGQPDAQDTTESKMMQPASQQAGSSMPKMTCPMCTKGAPAVEAGTATEEDGVQVVRITQKDGYYSPNEITLKAGMPAKLVFTGEAKDCSGKPKIAELNKQVDFTATGEATMDLDALIAGTYKLTCGMDSDGGSLIVQ